MNEQVLLDRIRRLPPEKQDAVEHFIEEIERHGSVKKPRRDLMGLAADLGEHISAEDIDEARREMWGNFPRDDI
ncbi:MAG: hypothetical protein ACREDR_18815 [Blastocatellia bacterium]